MTRVSQQEMYDDKDIITQICKLKDLVATGTYKDVDVQDDGNGNIVFTFTDQRDDVQTFTIPVKLISSVTSSQSGSTVTMRITWTDGTHDDYTWTAGGDVTTNTNQTITAIKTFSQSPIVPNAPSGPGAAVNLTYVSKTDGTNNLVHTSANETIAGTKTFSNTIQGTARQLVGYSTATAASVGLYRLDAKIAKTELTGSRNHLVFSVFTRSRNNSPDFICIYTTSGAPQGITMILRTNIANYEYVLSEDTDYIYLYHMTQAGAYDSIQLVLMLSSEDLPYLTNLGDNGDYAAPEGTEVGRLAP